MKKLLAVVLILALLVPGVMAEKADDYLYTVDFEPGKKTQICWIANYSVYITGEYEDVDLLRERKLDLNVELHNDSDLNFYLCIDSIEVNGWSTSVKVPLFQKLMAGSKKMDKISVYYTEAGIKQMDQIESILIKAHVFDDTYRYEFEMLSDAILFHW